VFNVQCIVNGRWKRGWGWIEAFHDTPLPELGAGPKSITGGNGVIWFGWQRFEVTVDVTVQEGSIDQSSPDLFDLKIPVTISDWRRRDEPHNFDGQLSHRVFPPTIEGWITH
jgi:hypothetical protein